jgi:3-hydroxy-9,10-secoandrosta-1,3,5(10)-triene-9,17-dione monooxygenase
MSDVAVTADEVVARADALRPRLLEEQAATEARTRYSEELHEAFRDAGFYRILEPRRYGGLELDTKTYYRVISSISRGCPSTGWMLCLGAGHVMQVATSMEEEAQEELLGGEDFIASASFAFQDALAEKIDGGYRVRGTWHFCSGAPYSTHHMGLAPTSDGRMVVVTIPRDQYTVLDNWGDLIGLKGSGSNSITAEDAVIPERWAIPFDEYLGIDRTTTRGWELHRNPLYAGSFMAFAMGELNSVQVGNAQGAIDEFERLLSRPTMAIGGGPTRPRYEDQNFQRILGLALGYTDAAYSILMRCGELYVEHSRAAMEDGDLFSREKTFRIYGQLMTAHKLCWEAGDMVFRAGSTTGARDGSRLQRFWRDLCAFRTNGVHQLDFQAPNIAQAHLGLAMDFLG